MKYPYTKIPVAKLSKEEWLMLRKKGIGGSEAAIILGLSPWTTIEELWKEKTSDTVTNIQNESMYWGTLLEDIVAKEFAKRTGMNVYKYQYMLFSTQYPFITANVDRRIKNTNDKFLGLECKTTSFTQKQRWNTIHIPLHYYAQVQQYMYVTGAEEWYVAVLIGGNYFLAYHVKRDEPFINEMVKKEVRFWIEYVVPQQYPYCYVPTTTIDENWKQLVERLDIPYV